MTKNVDDVVLVIYPHNAKTKLLYGGISNVAGHFLTRPYARLVTTRADTARSSVALGDTGCFGHSGETPTLHAALKATTSAEICIFLRFIGVKKQIKNTILYMRPVQERQQSLSLMEKLNSEKRTREQLQEDVVKLQVSFTVNLQFVIKLDTKKQKMFLFLISK